MIRKKHKKEMDAIRGHRDSDTHLHVAAFLFFCLIFALPLISSAQDTVNSSSGFSGRFQAGGSYFHTDSQLFVDDKNRRNDNLEGSADSYDLTSAMASLYLRYQFESGTALYVGNPLDLGDGLNLGAGIIQPVGSSALDISVNWLPVNEVWENPYETTRKREKSDADLAGVGINFQHIGGTPWEIKYRMNRLNIEEDVIGRIEPDLKRDWRRHELGVKYTIKPLQWIEVSPEAWYIYNDSDGDANSYQGMRFQTMLTASRPPWVFMGIVSGAEYWYEETHPLYGKTRQQYDVSVFLQVMRLHLFGSKRLFANALIGTTQSNANIDFFDSQTFIGLAGIGVNF